MKAFLVALVAAWSQPQPAGVQPPPVWITLGTQGGPVPSPERAQPANLLLAGNEAILIDAEDGTAQQLAKASVSLSQLSALFLSHLHLDHAGGVGGIIGLRLQMGMRGPLRIFGPPGTREMVAGIVASLRPSAGAGFGLTGGAWPDPAAIVEVVELSGGEAVEVAGFAVRAAENSHYSFASGSDEARRYRSLAYRFDGHGRSMAYTGDTGPSEAVERLARDVDLLVAEMIDVPAVVGAIRQMNPNMPPAAVSAIEAHLAATISALSNSATWRPEPGRGSW